MPMPWLDAKGLLPGRGPPGFGAPGLAAEPGFAAAGFSAVPGFAAAGLASAGFAEGLGPPGLTSARASAAGELFGSACSAAGAGVSGLGAGFGPGLGPLPAGFLAAGFAAAPPSPWDLVTPSASRAALTFRATGGAMLDEDALTNSPISLSLARTTLLSTPISAAISCTRGFATFLLSGFTPDRREP